MGRHLKMRTVTCMQCGREFETSSTNALRCPECRVKAAKEAQRICQAKRREANRLNTMATYDTPEQLNACLTCKVPASKCNGEYDKIRGM